MNRKRFIFLVVLMTGLLAFGYAAYQRLSPKASGAYLYVLMADGGQLEKSFDNPRKGRLTLRQISNTILTAYHKEEERFSALFLKSFLYGWKGRVRGTASYLHEKNLFSELSLEFSAPYYNTRDNILTFEVSSHTNIPELTNMGEVALFMERRGVHATTQ